MATKILRVGPEDVVNEIDTNADGVPDVRVITDNAPQQSILMGLPPLDPPPGAPFALGAGSNPDPLLAINARTWRDRVEV